MSFGQRHCVSGADRAGIGGATTHCDCRQRMNIDDTCIVSDDMSKLMTRRTRIRLYHWQTDVTRRLSPKSRMQLPRGSTPYNPIF